MKTLREVLGAARQKQVAIGHFNISDLAGLKEGQAVHKTVTISTEEAAP